MPIITLLWLIIVKLIILLDASYLVVYGHDSPLSTFRWIIPLKHMHDILTCLHLLTWEIWSEGLQGGTDCSPFRSLRERREKDTREIRIPKAEHICCKVLKESGNLLGWAHKLNLIYKQAQMSVVQSRLLENWWWKCRQH